MTAIGGRFVIFNRKQNVLFAFPTVLDAETQIIGSVRMALEYGSLIIVRRESEIRLNSNSSFKTDYKAVLCVCIIQF
jgi:hypothetical protein